MSAARSARCFDQAPTAANSRIHWEPIIIAAAVSVSGSASGPPITIRQPIAAPTPAMTHSCGSIRRSGTAALATLGVAMNGTRRRRPAPISATA